MDVAAWVHNRCHGGKILRFIRQQYLPHFGPQETYAMDEYSLGYIAGCAETYQERYNIDKAIFMKLPIITPIINAADGLYKTAFGSRYERDKYQAEETEAVMDQYSAEFTQQSNRTWFDSLVDGINRLIRPFICFSLFGLWFMAYHDPERFSVIMAALGLMPDQMWMLSIIVISFFFGSRGIEKHFVRKQSFEQRIKEHRLLQQRAKEIQAMKDELAGEERPEEQEVEGLPWLENPSVQAWREKMGLIGSIR